MAPRELGGWVRAARTGNRRAVGLLYEYLRRRLLPELQRSVPSQDAEDILHEAMLLVWQDLERLRADENFLSYARQVASHLIAKRQRKSYSWRLIYACPETPSFDPSKGNLEAHELLTALVGALNEQELELFRVLYLEGLKNQEAQRRLGVPSGVFRHRKHKLHMKLRPIALRLSKCEVDPLSLAELQDMSA